MFRPLWLRPVRRAALLNISCEGFQQSHSMGIDRDGEVVGLVSYRSISRMLSILRKLGIDGLVENLNR